jgi:hypothetical protein
MDHEIDELMLPQGLKVEVGVQEADVITLQRWAETDRVGR